MRVLSYFLFASLLISPTPLLNAHIIHVPADFPTIQGGINASVDGDTVMVAPGIYFEHDIDFLGKAITVMSTAPEDSAVVAATVVDADSAGGVFNFTSGEDTTSILTGFTLTGGRKDRGGGIYCEGSSPSILNNVITANWACGAIFPESRSTRMYQGIARRERGLPAEGGGIYCRDASPTVSGNYISENVAGNTDFQSPGFGGGLSCENSSPLLLGNSIRANRAFGASGLDSNLGGGIFCSYSSPIISNNIITGNKVDTLGFGGGISCYGSSSPLITNNIIVENVCETVYGGGGGVYSSESSPILSNNVITGNRDVGLLCVYSSIVIINTIIWGNLLGEIVVIEPPVITVNYSDIEGGWEGEGNIDADPFFVSFRGFDYLLRKGSPCIDAGDPAIEDGREWPVWYNNGPRADMGAYGGPGNVGWLRH